jgi:hypothetical protein
VGGHGQGHVAVPAGVAADLVVVQAAAFLLRGLEALLDGPSGAGNADQLVEGRVGRPVGDVVGRSPVAGGLPRRDTVDGLARALRVMERRPQPPAEVGRRRHLGEGLNSRKR